MELLHVVKVLEECQVSPPPGSVPPTSLSLTFFDILYLLMAPVQRLFFYEFHHSKAHFLNTVLPNIKRSLSLTLRHFYPLAGNLKWPEESTIPELVYDTADAVSLTVAESDYDFHQLSADHPRDASVSHPLIPKIHRADEKCVPLLALQVTHFPNKGICVGITISHVAADGRTSNHFMKSWASVCKLEGNTSSLTDSPPFHNRSLLDTLNPKLVRNMKALAKLNVTKEAFHTLQIEHAVPLDKVRATFVMSRSDITKLKQLVLVHMAKENEEGMPQPLHLSSFVVTCAYAWVCWLKARWGETDASEAIEHVIVPADATARLIPPLPVTYFGNCLTGVIVKVKRSDLVGKDGIAIAAVALGRGIQSLDVYEQMELDILSDYMSVPQDQILGLASSPKFGVYETDFGWGKPKKVEMSSIATGDSISVMECPNEEGAIELGLVRKRIEMDAFAFHFANSLNFIY